MKEISIARFRAVALLGYALVIVVLGAGLAIGLGRIDAQAGAGLAQVHEAERTATAAERVRWSAAVISAVGRAYLLVGDTKLFEDLTRTEAAFDERLRNLEARPHAAELQERLRKVDQVAATYRRALARVIADKERGASTEQLAAAFDANVQVRHELDRALDHLVSDSDQRATRAYDSANDERGRWMLWARAIATVLVAMAMGFAWYFTTLLTRAHDEERRARETAGAAVRARDELLGVVAHDLRNPLAAISLKAAALRKGLRTVDPRAVGASIEHVAIRMEYLIKGMLDAAVLEAGHFSVSLSRCDVDSLVAETEDMFAGAAAAKEIHWTTTVPRHGLAVCADRERVIEVLSNLLGNALKFTPRGGQVALAVEQAGGTVCFAVSDDGPGIPRGAQPRVFERFVRAERGGAKGTGLGLFIAKGIVDAHGGRIWLESEPGHGATFYFTLPAARSAPAESPITEPVSAGTPARG